MKLWNMKSYVAFGDSLNDVEMFKHASFRFVWDKEIMS